MPRILHVVGAMNRAGAETWLMHVLRRIDRARFSMDFLVHGVEAGAYDDEIRALGSRVLPCLGTSRPAAYARNFRRVLREHGPYDIVHSHVQHFGGWVCRLARSLGVPTRLVHAHADTRPVDREAGPGRRAYLRITRRWIEREATAGIAVSRDSAEALFGPGWADDPRWRVLPCGIDLEPFRAPVDRAALRASLGFAPENVVLGHVGRFDPQKNHTFLLDIAARAVRAEPRVRVLLVGDGPLRARIERRVVELGLDRHVLLAGVRDDVVALMGGAMDALLLPSRFEGVPLVLTEAQAAGLSCVISDVIPSTCVILPERVRRMSLSEPAAAWAEAALAAAGQRSAPARPAWRALEGGPLDLATSVRGLIEVYRDAAV